MLCKCTEYQILFMYIINTKKLFKQRGFGMIKGCTKRVIVVKNMESDLFEEAYFIVKPSPTKLKASLCENDFLCEADKIVSQKSANSIAVCSPAKAKRRSFPRDSVFFVFGCTFSAVIIMLIKLVVSNFA